MAKSRRAIAEQLLGLQSKIASDLLKIDACKEQLRAIAEDKGEGFVEEVEGVGSVEVKAGTEKKFKGLVPALKPETYLALPEARQKALQEQGLVAMEAQYTSARSPSVTVRL